MMKDMFRYGLAALLIVAYSGFSQSPQPVNQEEVLRKIRDFGENYGARLRDFSCNKQVIRQASRPGKPNDWSDRSEEEIDYVGQTEARHLIAIDGVPVKGKQHLKHGYTVLGEFGMLGRIFGKTAQAQFEWQGMKGTGDTSVCTYTYRIKASASPVKAEIGHRTVLLSHHGQVSAFCSTGIVTELEAVTDEAPDDEISLLTSVQFEPATIAGKEYQLPVTARGETRFKQETVRSQIRFRNYRKYDASSAIRFEPDTPPE